MFSCEFFEIFKNTFFTEHLQTTAFEIEVHTADQLIIQKLIPSKLQKHGQPEK